MTTDPRLHTLLSTLTQEMVSAHAQDVANLELLESNLQGLLDELDIDEKNTLQHIASTKTDRIVAAQQDHDEEAAFTRQRSQALKTHVQATLDKVKLNLQKATRPTIETPTLQAPESSGVKQLENQSAKQE
jgi:hypothetical protein